MRILIFTPPYLIPFIYLLSTELGIDLNKWDEVGTGDPFPTWPFWNLTHCRPQKKFLIFSFKFSLAPHTHTHTHTGSHIKFDLPCLIQVNIHQSHNPQS